MTAAGQARFSSADLEQQLNRITAYVIHPCPQVERALVNPRGVCPLPREQLTLCLMVKLRSGMRIGTSLASLRL